MIIPAELEKICLSFIPCKGITENMLKETTLKRLSQETLLTRKLRPLFGDIYTSLTGYAYVITSENNFIDQVTYLGPLGECWYPLGIHYTEEGEYRCLCIEKTGEWICEWHLGEASMIRHSSILRLSSIQKGLICSHA